MPRHNNTEKHQLFTFHFSCQNKRRYKTENEALKAAEFQMLQDMNLELSVYKCNDCSFWHLTRQIHRQD